MILETFAWVLSVIAVVLAICLTGAMEAGAAWKEKYEKLADRIIEIGLSHVGSQEAASLSQDQSFSKEP